LYFIRFIRNRLAIYLWKGVIHVIEVKRKKGESIESLLRRFTRRLQQSKLLIRAKESKFYKSPENKRAKKERALQRKDIRAKKEYLRRIGSLKD